MPSISKLSRTILNLFEIMNFSGKVIKSKTRFTYTIFKKSYALASIAGFGLAASANSQRILCS
jgi:hypothetical protein